MRRIQCILASGALALMTMTTTAGAQDVAELRQDTLIAAAERAALEWLGLIDEGRWEQAFAQMVDMLRNSVSMAEWRATIEQGRAPLQPLGERRLIAASRTTDYTGSLAVQLVFRLASPGHPNASETLVVSPGPAGGWRIASIGIRRADPGRTATIPAGASAAPAVTAARAVAVSPRPRARPRCRTSCRATPAFPGRTGWRSGPARRRSTRYLSRSSRGTPSGRSRPVRRLP